MSEENIEVVLDAFRAWNAKDADRFRALFHPDVIVRAPPGWPEPGPFVGRDAVMQQFTQMRETFDRESFNPVGEFRTAGDRVVVRVHWSTIGRGPRSDLETTMVITVRKGLIFHQEYFWDHDEALEAAGLRE